MTLKSHRRMRISAKFGALRDLWPAILAGVIVIVSCSAVATRGVIATAGGSDQKAFHLPSVVYLRDAYPEIDIAEMRTATGPLYHMLVAAPSRLFHLTVPQMQIAGSFFGAVLVTLAVWFSRKISNSYHRVLAVAPLLFSAYFWESSLWMLTDDTANLFAFGAFLIIMSGTDTRRQITSGLLIAAAIATRQTFVWTIAPVCASTLYALRSSPIAERIFALTRLSAPGLIVLSFLIISWGGLTPPAGRGNAASISPAAISFAFAQTGVFAIPIVIALVDGNSVDKRTRFAAIVGIVVALPAILFPTSPTTPPDDSRRGGAIWSIASISPNIMNRSLLLIALAFFGGAAATILYFELSRQLAILLATGLFSVALVSVAVSQLFQKYFEIPISLFAVIAIVSLYSAGRIVRNWPLLLLAVLQASVTIGIVAIPILRSWS